MHSSQRERQAVNLHCVEPRIAVHILSLQELEVEQLYAQPVSNENPTQDLKKQICSPSVAEREAQTHGMVVKQRKDRSLVPGQRRSEMEGTMGSDDRDYAQSIFLPSCFRQPRDLLSSRWEIQVRDLHSRFLIDR